MTALLHERFASTAARRGSATAVVSGDRSVSYAEIEALSNCVAHALAGVGCRRGDRVVLMLPKDPGTIAAMLGTLKAGCAYVPVDLASPASRAARIVAASEPRVVLVAPGAETLLDGVIESGGVADGVVIGTLGSDSVSGARFSSTLDGRVIASQDDSAPAIAVRADDPAHILFTSGSTGVPKGVLITHANVSAFLDWAVPHFGIVESDRLSSHPPLHFDLSTFDVYGALSAGAELHLVDPLMNLTPHTLGRFIEESALTQWFSVPSTMTFLASFDAVPRDGWRSLKRVLFCGEVLPTPVLSHWMARLPHATFTNLYGPTEATIASSYYTVPGLPADETIPIPIGTACAGEELVVLDEELRAVTVGEIGDLYIGGVGLSPGYWRDPEKTGLAFVPDPRDPARRVYRTGDLARIDDDGLFHFLGRVDSQIKSRGYRIELGEIEVALTALDSIAESAVVGVQSDGFEGTQIGCAYAPAPDRSVTPAELKAQLGTTLPRYMIPTRWLQLAELPKNANGKIDRARLRDLLSQAERETARTT